jgi:hypothetical protein
MRAIPFSTVLLYFLTVDLNYFLICNMLKVYHMVGMCFTVLVHHLLVMAYTITHKEI